MSAPGVLVVTTTDWHLCRCPHCRQFHYDVITAGTPVRFSSFRGRFAVCVCHSCFADRNGKRAADAYLAHCVRVFGAKPALEI